MSGGELLFAVLIITGAAALQAAVGFGANLLAAPLLLLIDHQFVPGPLIVVGLVLTVLMVIRERESAGRRELGIALSGRLVGTAIGAFALVTIPTDQISILFGLLLLLAVAVSATGWHLRPTPSALVGAGVMSGFMGTTVSVGGPPMALVYQRDTGPRLRGTMARLLAIGAAISLATVIAVGRFGTDELIASAALLPGVVVGFALSPRLARHIDRGRTRNTVLILSAVSAVAVLVEGLT